MGTLNPKTFESGKFCRVNDFFSNPDIFPPAIFWVCGKTKMEDLVLTLLTVSGCLILLQVQAINFIMCTAIFLKNRKLLSQGSLTSATLLRQRRRWQDRRPRRFWVRPGRTVEQVPGGTLTRADCLFVLFPYVLYFARHSFPCE